MVNKSTVVRVEEAMERPPEIMVTFDKVALLMVVVLNVALLIVGV